MADIEMNTIEEAIAELQMGHCIMVVDDPDRENEGDLICAAQYATQANVNLMASQAKGLICMPMSAEIAARLQLDPMVTNNTDNHETAFTVSIDHVDTTTGISAAERGYTARKVVEEGSRPEDFRRPGHMFPLIARPGGVLQRNGHTEATVDLLRHAGIEAVRPVLRDYARRRHDDAHHRAGWSCQEARRRLREHQAAPGLLPRA